MLRRQQMQPEGAWRTNDGLPYKRTDFHFVPKTSALARPALKNLAGLSLQGAALSSLLALQDISAFIVFPAALVSLLCLMAWEVSHSEDPD